jgi:hypothetical protein
MPRVIARFPFIGGGNAWTDGAEALALCPVSLVPTGRDRSYLMAEAAAAIDREHLESALRTVGFAPLMLSRWSQPAEQTPWLSLIEVDGFVADDDSRLNALAYSRGDDAVRLRVVGGYACPLGADDLTEVPPRSAGRTVRA